MAEARLGDDAPRRPRLVVLTTTFPRWRDDPEPPFVFELCRRLAARFDVTVIAPAARGAASTEMLDGVRVRRFRYAPVALQQLAYEGGIMAKLKRRRALLALVPAFVAGLWWAARRELRAGDVDVVHAHWLFPPAWLAVLARGGRRMPILATSHGGDLFGLRGAGWRRLLGFTVRRCAALTCVSEAMVPPLVALGAPRAAIEVISMGVDVRDRFTPDPTVARAPATLLFIGRLVEKKGVPYLIEAIAQLTESHPALQLEICGDGPERGALEQLARERGVASRVRFLGAQRQDALVDRLRRATCFVAPFVVARDGDQEGLGLVVVEAMACACPVITTDVPAVREAVAPVYRDALVPMRDAAALTAAIDACLRDPDGRAARAADALAFARETFGWDRVAARYGDRLAALVPTRDATVA